MKKKTILLGFLALSCGLSMLSAQVTIGADNAPQPFSVLELISGNDKGLRLPQLTTAQRNAIITAAFRAEPKAQGLQIFNITTKCIETWNGVKWIESCAKISKCTVKSTLRPEGLTFMCHNLGADPNMTIAEQMNYTPSPNNTLSADATVYGDLYQWGRVADGHQLRNSSAVNGGSGATSITYDANSQIPFGHAWYGKYVYFGGNPRDWHGNSTTDQNDDLWNFSVPMYRDNNNPCPAGWKVPSIDELRSIFNGNSAHISGLSSGWVSVSSGNNVRMSSSNTNGMEISTDGGSTTSLFLPYAGYRSDGSNSIGGTSTYGGYWSSTPNGTDIYFVNFSNDAVFPDGSRTRAYGRSVRCLAEY